MARKFLQMGFTRSRRYANHKSGKKYSEEDLENPKKIAAIPKYFDQKNKEHFVITRTKKVRPQEADALTNEKAESAKIFYEKYEKAKNNTEYLRQKEIWKEKF